MAEQGPLVPLQFELIKYLATPREKVVYLHCLRSNEKPGIARQRNVLDSNYIDALESLVGALAPDTFSKKPSSYGFDSYKSQHPGAGNGASLASSKDRMYESAIMSLIKETQPTEATRILEQAGHLEVAVLMAEHHNLTVRKSELLLQILKRDIAQRDQFPLDEWKGKIYATASRLGDNLLPEYRAYITAIDGSK